MRRISVILGLLVFFAFCAPAMAVTQYNLTVGSDTVVVFNGTAGNIDFIIPANINTIQFVVIAGAGAGGSSDGGGGGAGGVLNGTASVLPGSIYNITVGAGGTGYSGSPWYGTSGSNSTLKNATVKIADSRGGGGGSGAGTVSGFAGGSGGGGTTSISGLAGTAGQGNAGGNGNGAALGGGGGGNGSVGTAATSSIGGKGGSGFLSSITGVNVEYACGGGGGTSTTVVAGAAGCAGAGKGGNSSITGSALNAAPNSGSGGGGSLGGAGNLAGAGGSGIVIIRYTTTAANSLIASFTSVPNPSAVDQSVQFNDTSTGSPTTWNWTFGDGNTSTLQNPAHAFPAAGTYSVYLNVTNSTGSFSDITVNQTVTSATAPLAMFTKNFWLVIFPRPIQFNDTSTNTPTTWNWSFGDGKYSDSQNPSHQYVKRGKWTVLLNASNTAGYSTNTSIVTILGG